MNQQDVQDALVSNIKEIIELPKDTEIDVQKNMKDYGADSLQMVEVVSRTMKQLRIKIPRTELNNIQNISQLIDLFVQHSE